MDVINTEYKSPVLIKDSLLTAEHIAFLLSEGFEATPLRTGEGFTLHKATPNETRVFVTICKSGVIGCRLGKKDDSDYYFSMDANFKTSTFMNMYAGVVAEIKSNLKRG
jgi:hypothetical protein